MLLFPTHAFVVLFVLATTFAFTPPSHRVLHHHHLVPRDPYSHHGHYRRSSDKEEHVRALRRRLEDGLTTAIQKRSVGEADVRTLVLREEERGGGARRMKRDVNGTISYLGTKSG